MAEKQAINQKVERIFYFLVNMQAQIEIAVTKLYRSFEMLERLNNTCIPAHSLQHLDPVSLNYPNTLNTLK